METARLAKTFLERYYAGQVAVAYEDAASPAVSDRYATVLLSVPPEQLAYPLLVVNGEVRAVGELDVYLIFQSVRDALEAQPQPGQIMG